ncbi:MAG: glutaredoxin domain-containing protein [Planctomycetota bacterium]
MKQRATVVVYRTRTCPFCIAAEELLQARGITFDEVHLDDSPARRAVTSSILPGHMTVPLVLIDDRPIGGYDALRAMDRSGELRSSVFSDEL